jgi:tetratricopeptide (TPR) repeat protein
MADRAAALAPGTPDFVLPRVIVALTEGDVAGAGRVLAAATDVPAADLVAEVARFWYSFWVLDDPGQRLALSLGPEAFDGDRGVWGLVRAQLHAWRGDSARSRAWADTAARHFAAQLRATPDADRPHLLRGLALAYLGRHAEAVKAGERGVALKPVSADANIGAYNVHLLARIHLLAGQHEQALDRLESLMKIPYYLTPAWVRIDPTFAPLRGHPRFERLAAGR